MSITSAAKRSVEGLLKRTRDAGRELGDGLESVRRRVRDLQAQRSEIADLPPTQAVAFERIDEFVRGITTTARHRAPDPTRFVGPPAGYTAPRLVDLSDLFAAYMGPALADAMKAEVEDLYESTPGVTEDDRADRLEKIDGELLDAELAEESIIRAAEAAGFPMARRYDADPRVVLAHDKALP